MDELVIKELGVRVPNPIVVSNLRISSNGRSYLIILPKNLEHIWKAIHERKGTVTVVIHIESR